MPGLQNVFAPDCFCQATDKCRTEITVGLSGCASGDLCYDLTGTTTGGAAVSLSGCQGYGGGTTSLSLSFAPVTLPEGSYSIHVYSKSTACGQPYGVDGIFDGTKAFSVACPLTRVSMSLAAAFDLVVAGTQFVVVGCQTWRAAALPTVNLAATITAGPATICSTHTHTNPSINDILSTVKATGYPFTIRFDATGPDVLAGDQSFTFTDCKTSTNDSNLPAVMYKYWPIAASACDRLDSTGAATGSLPLPNATVSVTGGITGSATTAADDILPTGGTMTLSAWVQDKVGVDPATRVYHWSVAHADFATRAFDGPSCPGGGPPGAILAGHACCGCGEPTLTTLHASIIGVAVTLTYDPALGWVGTFTKTINCSACALNAPPTTGIVHFYALFGGVDSAETRPFIRVWYYGSAASGAPWTCSPGTTPFTDNSNNWHPLNTSAGPYSSTPTYSADCSPLTATMDGTWYYGVPRNNGSGITDYFGIPLGITVSE